MMRVLAMEEGSGWDWGEDILTGKGGGGGRSLRERSWCVWFCCGRLSFFWKMEGAGRRFWFDDVGNDDDMIGRLLRVHEVQV